MKPTIKISQETPDVIRFTLSNADVCIANSLRRVLISEIPTVGIVTDTHATNKCNITANTTRFHNEILKHRLSCIPIHINEPSKFDLNKYIIVVDKQNDSDKQMYITTEDFNIVDVDTKLPVNKTVRDAIFPKNKITNYYIDFCKLRPKLADDLEGECLKFTATMEIVKGSKTFNTCSVASYGNTVDTKLAAAKWDEKEKELRSSMSKEEISYEKTNWYLLEAKRLFIPNSFDFTIETVGVYTNRQLVQMACNVILQKMDTLKTIIDEGNLQIEPSLSTLHNCFDIKIMNENYTVGNLLSYMVNIIYKDTNEIKYNGVQKPHPHDDFIVLRLSLESKYNEEFINICLLTSIKYIIDIYSQISKHSS